MTFGRGHRKSETGSQSKPAIMGNASDGYKEDHNDTESTE